MERKLDDLRVVVEGIALALRKGSIAMEVNFDEVNRELAALTEDITELRTVEEGEIRLLEWLHEQLAAIEDAPTPEAIRALRDSVREGTAKLVAATLANTPEGGIPSNEGGDPGADPVGGVEPVGT